MNIRLFLQKSLKHRRLATLCMALLFMAIASSTSTPVQAVSPDIVISQVYGGGGNSGATLKNDFIELFNRGTSSVNVTGWSVQYTSATGTGNFGSTTSLITPISGTIAPGQYFLIQEAQGSGGTTNLPTPDITDSTPINMSATDGKVALVNTTTPLGCNGGSTPCPPAALATIVDLVGYGSANFFEGAAAAPTLSNTTAALRANNGCTDTDNNSTDFAAGAPNPRNTSSPLFPCSGTTVTSTTPTNGAINVALNSNIIINFSQSVTVSGTWFTISCTTSGAHAAVVSGGPQSYTLNPNADFANADTCTVTIVASQVSGLAANYVFSFSTIPPSVAIHDIQGVSHTSPYSGTLVATTGIVTAKRSNGFHIQDPNPDGNDATSEGLFVFTSSAPTASVGDAVLVTGTVKEFRSGGASSTNLTTTEIDNPGRAVTIQSSGNPLPAPVVIGSGGRVPPSTVIEDDASGSVETSGVFDPSTDGIDFYESLESMRVQLNSPVVVGPWHDFGTNREVPVIPDNGAGFSLRTARGGIIIRPNDFNPERLILNDLVAGGPTLTSVNVADHYNGAVVGVIDYNFGNFKLEVSAPLPPIAAGGLPQEVTDPLTAHQLSAATFNVENLAPSDPPSKFSTLASLIVNNLKSPDLIAVEEVQDNSGATDNGIVDATTTWNMLSSAITAAGGPTYQFRQINPVNNQDGGAPGGNIRQGFLFRTNRGLAFVDRPGGTSTNSTGVTGSGASTQLTFSPGRIDPTNAAFNTSRKPLAGEFAFKGDKVFVIANHWNSKSGDQPLFGRFQPPNLSSETQRNQQATVVKNFVRSLLTADPNANVVVLGDLNDFEFSNPIMTLKSAPLNDLIETLSPNERYTYVFDGNSQTLDHSLVSNGIFGRPRSFDVVHVNSEFATQSSDHEPQVSRLCVDRTPPALNITLSPNSLWPPDHQYVTVNATVRVSDNADPSPTFTFVSATSNEADNGLGDGDQTNDVVVVNSLKFNLRAERSALGTGRVYTITYRATDACGNSAQSSATVTVPLNQGN